MSTLEAQLSGIFVEHTRLSKKLTVALALRI